MCACKYNALVSDWLMSPINDPSPGSSVFPLWCMVSYGVSPLPPPTGDRTRGAGLERSPLRRHFNLGNDET